MDTLDVRIQSKHDTTAHWAIVQASFIPLAGEVIIYDDYKTVVEDGVTKNVPGVKIGTGNAYLGDLPFVTVTEEQNRFWNNKLNLLDNVLDETLVFTRD